jgi:hypothetical protein
MFVPFMEDFHNIAISMVSSVVIKDTIFNAKYSDMIELVFTIKVFGIT